MTVRTTLVVGGSASGREAAIAAAWGLPAAGLAEAGLAEAGLPRAVLPRDELPPAGLPRAVSPPTELPRAGSPLAGSPEAGLSRAGLSQAESPAPSLPMAGAPGAIQDGAAILEGLSDGHSPLADLADHGNLPSLQLIRIAPGCLCCAGNMILKVTLNRLLRRPPAHLFISLADATHVETLRAWLSSAPYDTLLCLDADIRVS